MSLKAEMPLAVQWQLLLRFHECRHAECRSKCSFAEQVLEELVTGDMELPPVSAVLGGVLANEVLKVVSHKGEPVNNFFFFSVMDNIGQIETLG